MLCLGEALVDLVGHERGRPLPEARHLTPHLGGAVANVAVYAARAGAEAALAGGAGDDVWGRWLRERLAREGVDTSLFVLAEGALTPLALVTLDADGQPEYELRAEPSSSPVAQALEGRLEEAVSGAAGLVISSNTLSRPAEREATMAARVAALELERPVILDVNLRLHRWSSRSQAVASTSACVPGALLVRANRAEAELLTGERDPERAALALVERGARLVVVTLGPGGAILRGAERADCSAAIPRMVRSTAGAGDALTGTLVAHLSRGGFEPAAVAAALPDAIQAAAGACELWGSID